MNVTFFAIGIIGCCLDWTCSASALQCTSVAMRKRESFPFCPLGAYGEGGVRGSSRSAAIFQCPGKRDQMFFASIKLGRFRLNLVQFPE